MRLSRPDPATVRTAPPWPACTCPSATHIALLASTAVGVAIVTADLCSPSSGVEPSGLVRGLVVVPLAAAFVMFARVQLRLLRAEHDPYWPWTILGLGLVTSIATGEYWALGPGGAAILLRLDRWHALTALGGSALVVFAGDRLDPVDRTVGDTAADLVVQLALPALLLAALTRLALDLRRPRWLGEQLLRHQVDLERDRVARDAHDLMGRTLVTASIRTERVLHTLDAGDPAVLARVSRLRGTLAAGERRVRTMASGPVISTWDDELELASGLCARLGIELVVDEAHDPPSHHRALAGLVLRECVTVAITVRSAVRVSARLRITPDGDTMVRVVVDRTSGPVPGTPSRVLDAVDRVGGSVTVSESDGTWVLEAHLPTVPPARLLR
ncbi:MAG: histidine kinase [Dermatophilaceae bacterium]